MRSLMRNPMRSRSGRRRVEIQRERVGWGRWRVEIQREGVGLGAPAVDPEGGVVCGGGGSGRG